MKDEHLRKAIIAGVIFVVGACLISQIMFQMAGGPRDEPMDISDQLPADWLGSPMVFEDGLPPFISSGGVFQPEKAVFDIGLGLGGLLMMALSFEVYQRTEPVGRKRKVANVGALISGVIVGFSMFSLPAHPLNTHLMLHIFWAVNIFWGAQVWIGCLTYARGEIDAGLEWRGQSINRIRWALFGVTILSFQLMTALIATDHLVGSALFEWTLTFSAEAMILTLIPAITADDP
jgi:hypothetical protein